MVTRVQSHRDLVVWQQAMDLVVRVYQLAEAFPHREMYRLTSQITRAAVSVPANIAEGNARGSTRDYANFLTISKGSLMETETYIILAVRLGYVTEGTAAPVLALIAQISKMLTTLRIRLLQREPRS